MSYRQLLYQVVFSTKYRHPTLLKPNRAQLYAYMQGLLTNKKCFVHRINGIEDHLHIALDIHPSNSISDLIRDLKTSSNKFIRDNSLFPAFTKWQEGYSIFSYHIEAKPNLVRYIDRQEIHHQKTPYITELKTLLAEHQIDYDERYLE